ncbi:MAG: sensor histidine kinase, partial [Candidatus Entotheonellia bacterium]
ALDCLKRGAADYLLKDRLGRLGMAVMSVLEQRRLAEEKRQTEAALQESEACYRILVEGSIQGMYIHREGIIQFANRAMATMFGYESPTQLIGLNYRRLVAPHEWTRLEGYRSARLRGNWAPSHYEYQGMRKDGQLIWIECLASLTSSHGKPAIMATLIDISERKLAEEALREAKDVLERTVAERTLELQELNVRLLADITHRKRVEEQLKASVQEKELLLKEIHHRVKNNLQVISSLLSLQAEYIEDPHSRQLFSDSQHRVRSMALIHEKLYQSKNLAGIDLAEYIRCLADDLFRSYGVDGGRIALEINAEEVFLKIDAAIPCGLILHELLSNCLQHAFPDGRPGGIRIDLWSNPEGHLCLLVRDNGVGLPEELDFLNTDSLGLQLVKMLAEQLDGTIDLARGKGAAFSITFAGLKFLKGS